MRKFVAPLIKGLLFILVTALATTVLAVSISNTDVGDADHYAARFTDATALNTGDDVRISGVRVGQVEELSVVDQHIALVRFSVERGRVLPADVRATIKYRNMVGQRYVALERGSQPGAPALAPGGEIPLERTTPALDLTDLFNGFKPLFQALSPPDVNKLSGQIVQVLQGEGGTIEALLAHTASLTSTLAGRDRVIGEVITNLNTVLRTVNSKGDRLGTVVTTAQQLVSGLAQDRTAIGESIEGIAALSSATAGLFEAARPPLKESIAGLHELSGNLLTGQADVERFLTLLPEKMAAIGKLGSYASWMNGFLCEGVVLTDPARGYTSDESRCRR
ncbi:MCE family protein [Amycolatopsis suaedae]|uniref:MCE family protein n=1 Tax=Amycolatopsis suaedae TaxID=2510978 RepID=A0A4Q7JAC1_9PSEU|nr:MCE family protein [Amycolatopsis suaedae]RZQ64731.1 MCE family protein [Amycolatopsis suaedae]